MLGGYLAAGILVLGFLRGGKMKRGFVRALWGVYINDIYNFHRQKIDGEIEFAKHCRYLEPFTTYVFGKDNYEHLKSCNVEQNIVKLASNEPILWDMETQCYRHKLEAFKLGMQDFDEIVFLDWDTVPTKPLPPDFWEVLSKKDPIQAALIQYKIKSKSSPYWRKVNRSWASGAAWLYIRDKTIPDKIIKVWEDLGKGWSEELAITKYIDESMGGWKGLEEYQKRFEPDCFYHPRPHKSRPIHSPDFIAAKKPCFWHMGMDRRKMNRYLSNAKNIEWLK